MKVLFLDNREIHVGSKRVFIYNFYMTLKELNYNVELNKEINESYQVIILGKNLLKKSKNIKMSLNHKCLLGIVNPPNDDIMLEYKNIIDFCIAGSVEERDSLLKYIPNSIYYPLIEIQFNKIKKHTDKEELVIGYHGNNAHLKSFIPNINWALEEFSKNNKIKLKIITGDHNDCSYKWTFGRPNIKIEQVNWKIWSIEDELLECDIGLVPNVSNILEKHRKYILKYLDSNNIFGYDSDYILRFKNKSNFGRALVFMQLGIPIIADFTPCHFEAIKMDETGYLALSKEGWLDCLNKLKDTKTRKRLSENALKKFELEFNIKTHATKVYNEIELIYKSSK